MAPHVLQQCYFLNLEYCRTLKSNVNKIILTRMGGLTLKNNELHGLVPGIVTNVYVEREYHLSIHQVSRGETKKGQKQK